MYISMAADTLNVCLQEEFGRYLDNKHPKEGVLSSLYWT